VCLGLKLVPVLLTVIGRLRLPQLGWAEQVAANAGLVIAEVDNHAAAKRTLFHRVRVVLGICDCSLNNVVVLNRRIENRGFTSSTAAAASCETPLRVWQQSGDIFAVPRPRTNGDQRQCLYWIQNSA